MNKIKYFIKNYLQYFAYFYSHLRLKVFVSLFLSLTVGVLDGFGLAMFLPLLQMVDGNSANVDGQQLGNLAFLIDGLKTVGLSINLTSVLVVMLVFFTLKGLVKFMESYLKVIYQQYFMRKIRLSNINYLSNYSYNKFVKSDSGKIQNTFSGEVERVNQAYKAYFWAVQYGALVLVYVTLAFLANAQFAILVAVGGVLTNLIFKKLYKATKILSSNLTKENHHFQGLLIQKVNFFKYLKATGLIYTYADKLKENVDKIEYSQRRMGVLNALLLSIKEPLVMVVVVTVILIQVKVFSVNLGLIILSLLFFYRALTFVMAMQNYWNVFLSVSGSLENMTAFSKDLKLGSEKTGTIQLKQFKSKLEVRNLSFSYDNTLILDDVTFTISKNETIAIVGESGSGKTTLINILSGLLKPESGALLIDDIAFNNLDIVSYQNRIGYITQEPVIFNDTIYNNVTFWSGKTEKNITRFHEALKRAAIYEFVLEQPEQEDALLGNSGINISGGQKQRLSIARELFKDVDFLFLDEATSSLDSETENVIQENISKLKGEYTTIIIAHRYSTIKDADKIIYLNKGKIEHIGSFEDLRLVSSSFNKMVELQQF